MQVRWDTLFSITSAVDDTLFGYLAEVAASKDRVYVLDHYARRVLAFDTIGTHLWSFGHQGAGPGEFQQPHQIEVDPDGRPWVLDVKNARITILTKDGEFSREIPLQDLETRVATFVPLHPDSIIVVSAGAERPFWLLDSSGEVVKRLAHPSPAYQEMPPLGRQIWTGQQPGSRQWIAAFAAADGFVGFSGLDAADYRGWYPEVLPAPRVSETVTRQGSRTTRTTELIIAAPTTMDLAVGDSTIYMLFAGRTEEAHRILDLYDRTTGEYRNSLLIPDVVGAMTLADGRFYFATNDSLPTLWSARIEGITR